jgi:hypothetical protein
MRSLALNFAFRSLATVRQASARFPIVSLTCARRFNSTLHDRGPVVSKGKVAQKVHVLLDQQEQVCWEEDISHSDLLDILSHVPAIVCSSLSVSCVD